MPGMHAYTLGLHAPQQTTDQGMRLAFPIFEALSLPHLRVIYPVLDAYCCLLI